VNKSIHALNADVIQFQAERQRQRQHHLRLTVASLRYKYNPSNPPREYAQAWSTPSITAHSNIDTLTPQTQTPPFHTTLPLGHQLGLTISLDLDAPHPPLRTLDDRISSANATQVLPRLRRTEERHPALQAQLLAGLASLLKVVEFRLMAALEICSAVGAHLRGISEKGWGGKVVQLELLLLCWILVEGFCEDV